MEDGKPIPGSIYIYAPNKGAPVFFTIAFAASAVLHIMQCFRYKCWKLTWMFPSCAIVLVAGFAMREYGAFHYHIDDLNVYIASTVLIYTAPPILELQNYHILGRILYYVPYLSPMHPGRIASTFGTLSALVEVFNAIGVQYVANTNLPDNLIKLGHILMKVSLVLQLGVIGLFVLLAGTFHYSCIRNGIKTRKVEAPLMTLYASMILILTRCIYRTVEYFGTSDTRITDGNLSSLDPIVRYEWFFYVFEATIMLTNSVLWNTRHPRKRLPESHKVYLARDGVTEIEGPGWEDKRGLVMTALDPFGCFLRNKEEKPFWETDGIAATESLRQNQGKGF